MCTATTRRDKCACARVMYPSRRCTARTRCEPGDDAAGFPAREKDAAFFFAPFVVFLCVVSTSAFRSSPGRAWLLPLVNRWLRTPHALHSVSPPRALRHMGVSFVPHCTHHRGAFASIVRLWMLTPPRKSSNPNLGPAAYFAASACACASSPSPSQPKP